MPFEGSLAHAFTVGSIRAHAPTSGGVYGITNSTEWLYIGYSDNIQGALMTHLQDRGSRLALCRPAGFVFESSWGERQVDRCQRLIHEYTPSCNERSPSRTASARARLQEERG